MAKALVCFPPSLDLMARKNRLPHRVSGRPTVREAAVGGRPGPCKLDKLSQIWQPAALAAGALGPRRSANAILGASTGGGRSCALPRVPHRP